MGGKHMKTNLTIEGVEQKTSKAGRSYKSFKTSDGQMTCFEGKVVVELEKNIGKNVDVDVEERNGFKNIVSFIGVAQDQTAKPAQANNSAPFADERKSKQASMIISYVKDLIVAGKVEMKDFEAKCTELMGLQKKLETA